MLNEDAQMSAEICRASASVCKLQHSCCGGESVIRELIKSSAAGSVGNEVEIGAGSICDDEVICTVRVESDSVSPHSVIEEEIDCQSKHLPSREQQKASDDLEILEELNYVQDDDGAAMSEHSQKAKKKVEILRADSELDTQPAKSRLDALSGPALQSPETQVSPKLDGCANFVNSAKSQVKSPTGRGVFMSPKAQQHMVISEQSSPRSPLSPTQKEVEVLGYKGAYAKLLQAANKVINSGRNGARSRSVVHQNISTAI